MKKILIFQSIHYCIKADKALRESGLRYRIIATPTQISDECGMCIEVADDYVAINEILVEQNFEMKVYDI
jgi:uncharacterized protein (UPF0212 family)